MMITAHGEVRAGLAAHFTRLWRYGLVLSGRGDIAEDLVQATCVRAFERGAGLPPKKWPSLRYGSRELKEDVSDVEEEAQA